jgi:hypothetical protein
VKNNSNEQARSYVLVANEGKPDDTYIVDPQGPVSILMSGAAS